MGIQTPTPSNGKSQFARPGAPPGPSFDPDAEFHGDGAEPETLGDRFARWFGAVPEPKTPWRRYAVPVALVAVATVISLIVDETAGTPTAAIMILSVIFAAWLGGFGPGVAAVALASVSMAWLIREPRFDLTIDSRAAIIDTTVFAVSAAIAVTMYHMVHSVADRSMRLADDRARLLRAVLASEERWRTLTEAMPALMTSSSPRGAPTFFNSAYVDYTGVSQDELCADPDSVIAPDDLPRLAKAWDRARNSESAITEEWRVRGRDGVYRWHYGTTAPVRDLDGRVQSWVGAAINVDDRKRAAEQLHDALTLLDTLLAGAPAGFAYIDRDLRFVRINESLAAINDVPVAAHIGRTLRDVSPLMAPLIEPHIRQVLATGTPLSDIEYSGQSQGDGSTRYALASYYPVRGPDASIAGVGVIVQDITQRKQAETELRDTLVVLDALLDTSPAGFAYVDNDLRFVRVNDAIAALNGVPARDHIGRTFADVNPLMADAVVPGLRRVLETGKPLTNLEIRATDAKSPDGVRYSLADVYPVRAPGGDILGAGIVVQDITRRKRIEDALRQSEERYRMLAQAMPAMVAVHDPEGNAEYLSESWLDYTGLTREQCADWHGSGVLADDDLDAGIAAWKRGQRSGEAHEQTMRYRRYDGAYRWHLIRTVPLHDGDGRVARWLSVSLDINDRKLAEDRLRESEERYHVLSDSLPAIIATASPEQRFTYFNARWYEYTGLSEEESAAISFDTWRRVIHPDDFDGVVDHFNLARAEGNPMSGEFRIRRYDGEYRWHFGQVVPVYDERGEIANWVGTIIDTHDRKLAEEALEESRRQLDRQLAEIEALVQIAPVGIAIADDPLCTRMRVNKEFARILRSPSDDANISKTASTDVPDWFRTMRDGQEIEGSRLPMQRAASSGKPVSAEYVDLVFDNGDVTTIYGNAIPLLDGAGAVRGAVGAFVDISDRERYRRQQRVLIGVSDALNVSLDYNATLDAVLNSVVPTFADWCAVYVLEEDGRIERQTTTSQRHQKLNGARVYQSAADVPGYVRATIMHGRHQLYEDVTDELLKQAANDEQHLQRLQARAYRSGVVVPMYARGRIIGALAFGTAESGRRYGAEDLDLGDEIARRSGLAVENARLFRDAQLLLDQLRAALATKDEFLGMVSHELKTPITTILGNAEVLHKRANLISEQARTEALGDIRHDADRLNRIIANLLILARLEQGAMMDSEPLVLAHIVERAVEDQRRQTPARDIELQIEAGVQPVCAVQGYVEQVMQNLLSNADKYSPPQEPIVVQLSAAGDRVEVRVLDRGAGMSTDETEHIFTPFYRSPRTAEKAKGFGIGLAVCKRLIEAQGGEIWVRPRQRGGTEFGFSLPIDDESYEA